MATSAKKPAAAAKPVAKPAVKKVAAKPAAKAAAKPVVKKTAAKPAAKAVAKPVVKKTAAKKAGQPAAVAAEVVRPSTAATPGIKSALNPTGAWPFPTGSRPK